MDCAMSEYKKQPEESSLAFQYRVSQDHDLIGTWEDVAEICNRELGWDYTECKYRKDYATFKRIFEANEEQFGSTEQLKRIQEKKTELAKQARQYYDQRREYMKLVTKDARWENLETKLVEAAKDLNSVCPMVSVPEKIQGIDGCEAVLFLSDWHYGMVTDNVWNKYNTQICRERVEKMTLRAIKRLELHRPSKLHVVLLGDAAHGAIHVSARVKAEEDVCDQIMNVAELMAETINVLSAVVPEVEVYSTYGNHLRTVANKQESVHSDNMEKLIGWWMKQRLKDCDNINFAEEEYGEYVVLTVCGHDMVCTHGDLDSLKTMGATLQAVFLKMFGKNIEYTVSADKHHSEQIENLGIDSMTVPSLCGTDEYANGKRLYSNPGQILMFFNSEGKDAVYNLRVE